MGGRELSSPCSRKEQVSSEVVVKLQRQLQCPSYQTSFSPKMWLGQAPDTAARRRQVDVYAQDPRESSLFEDEVSSPAAYTHR